MTTLREAAANLLNALEASSGTVSIDQWVDMCRALRTALAEPTCKGDLQVEPVAWIQQDHLEKARRAPFLCRVEPTQRVADFVPLYTAPQRQPEVHPVTGEQLPTSTAGWLHYVTDRTSAAWQEGYERGLKREGQRQPLSDEEIMDLVRDMSIQMRWPSTPLDIARAIERTHGIGGQDEVS